MKKDILQRVATLLTCFLVLAVVSVHRDGTVLGHRLKANNATPADTAKNADVQQQPDGTLLVNTTRLGKNVKGYGGNVPLQVHWKEGRIVKIVPLKNEETPEFFAEATQLLARWIGKTPEEALRLKVDAVSGATFSSNAIIANVHLAAQAASKETVAAAAGSSFKFTWKYAAALLVLLSGAVVPLFYKHKVMRRIQFVLNIAVLGFWSGTFISYSLLVSYVSNGADLLASLIPLLMLLTAFVYPLFGKKNYYCNNLCPYGSIQELAGSMRKRKWKMSKKLVKRLEMFRELLWAVLMMLMMVGMAFEWMNYEVFSAFILAGASWVVLAIAAVFLVLSVFVPRPYCRFVCPTGTLFKVVQSGKVFKKR